MCVPMVTNAWPTNNTRGLFNLKANLHSNLYNVEGSPIEASLIVFIVITGIIWVLQKTEGLSLLGRGRGKEGEGVL